MNFLIFLLCASSLGSVNEAEVQRLLDRNEETLRGIHTVRAALELKRSQDGGQTWKTLQATEVVRSGPKEIVRDHLYGSYFQEVWRENEGRSSVLYTSSERRVLAGYKGDRPSTSPLQDEEVDQIKGAFSVMPDDGAAGWVISWKGQAMLQPSDLSLRGFLKVNKPQSVEKHTDSSGQTSWVLEVRPSVPGPFHAVRLTFSPSHGYLMVKQETDVDFRGKAGMVTRTVREFHDLGSGLWLPKTIETTVSQAPEERYVVNLSNVEVNRPIDDGEFRLEFPENAIVSDQRSKKYLLWGKGEPARTFESTDAFNEWNQRRQAKLANRLRNNPSYLGLAAGIACASGVALAGILLYRRGMARLAA